MLTKGPFINYTRVPRKGQGSEKSLHTLTLGRGSKPFLRNTFPSRYFILEIRRSSGLAGIIFDLHLEDKKHIRMSCFLPFLLFLISRQTGSFNVTDPFLKTFSYVEKEMDSYVRIGGRGLKNLTYPYMGVLLRPETVGA